jgi:hypothetical protein
MEESLLFNDHACSYFPVLRYADRETTFLKYAVLNCKWVVMVSTDAFLKLLMFSYICCRREISRLPECAIQLKHFPHKIATPPKFILALPRPLDLQPQLTPSSPKLTWILESNLLLEYQTTTAVMADGIDRKAEERMEFSTSKDVTVIPTFSDMSLKGRSYYCAEDNPILIQTRESPPRNLRIWI